MQSEAILASTGGSQGHPVRNWKQSGRKKSLLAQAGSFRETTVLKATPIQMYQYKMVDIQEEIFRIG